MCNYAFGMQNYKKVHGSRSLLLRDLPFCKLVVWGEGLHSWSFCASLARFATRLMVEQYSPFFGGTCGGKPAPLCLPIRAK